MDTLYVNKIASNITLVDTLHYDTANYMRHGMSFYLLILVFIIALVIGIFIRSVK